MFGGSLHLRIGPVDGEQNRRSIHVELHFGSTGSAEAIGWLRREGLVTKKLGTELWGLHVNSARAAAAVRAMARVRSAGPAQSSSGSAGAGASKGSRHPPSEQPFHVLQEDYTTMDGRGSGVYLQVSMVHPTDDPLVTEVLAYTQQDGNNAADAPQQAASSAAAVPTPSHSARGRALASRVLAK